jgi:hypothetical protein
LRAKRSHVHPPFKTKHRVTNWPTYDRELADRGTLTHRISPDAIKTWNAKRVGKRGGEAKHTGLVIEAAPARRSVNASTRGKEPA